MTSALLYLHGIRNDDPSGEWQAALDRSLYGAGLGDLDSLKLEVLAVGYLDLLEGDEPAPPSVQLRRRRPSPSDDSNTGYVNRMLALEQMLADGNQPNGTLRHIPETKAGDAFARAFLREALAYLDSPSRTEAIVGRLLPHLAGHERVLILGHSLGSVVALDLLPYLDADLHVTGVLTIGSPLGWARMTRRTQAVRRAFPSDRVGPWLNLVGKSDAVTGGRGLSRNVPYAADVFVNTGLIGPAAHSAPTYLALREAAQFFAWFVADRRGRVPSDAVAVEPAVPEHRLVDLARHQYLLRLEQAHREDHSALADRIQRARRLLAQEAAVRLPEDEAAQAVLRNLGRDWGAILRQRLSLEPCIELLVTMRAATPFEEFDIEPDEGAEDAALSEFSEDLGVRTQVARTVSKTVRRVEAALRPPRRGAKRRAGMIGLGAMLVVAAPALVAIAAPAGLAGAAATTAGLAALGGPGGMATGLTLVGLTGGVGGSMVLAGGLLGATPGQVETALVATVSIALSKHALGFPDTDHTTWFRIAELQAELQQEVAKHQGISDAKSRTVLALKQKLELIQRALDLLEREGMAPHLVEGAAG